MQIYNIPTIHGSVYMELLAWSSWWAAVFWAMSSLPPHHVLVTMPFRNTLRLPFQSLAWHPFSAALAQLTTSHSWISLLQENILNKSIWIVPSPPTLNYTFKNIKPIETSGRLMRRTDSLEKTQVFSTRWWGRLKAGGEGYGGWDGWMASPSWWTWVWASSGRWWWTGKAGVLQSMGLQS